MDKLTRNIIYIDSAEHISYIRAIWEWVIGIINTRVVSYHITDGVIYNLNF